MAYTPRQARNLAQQIFDRFGGSIAQATAGSHVPPDFLAGFVGVEAGKDRRGQIVPGTVRFEPGVYRKLRELRDGTRLKPWSGISRADLKGRDNAEIRILATSHGPAQIMGWHTIHNLKRTVADLGSPATWFNCAVELLELVGGAYLRRGDWTAVMHIWNTGRPTGKTYHEDYVVNALEVKTAYKQIARDHVSRPDSSIDDPPIAQPSIDPLLETDPERSDSAPDSGSEVETQNTAAAGDYVGKGEQILGKFETAGETIDRVGNVAGSIKGRTDSVKSLWSTIVGALFQAAFAVAGFLAGLPRSLVITVLVIVGVLVLTYLVRQILLALARENK